MTPFQEGFGLIPVVSGAVTEKVLKELEAFNSLSPLERGEWLERVLESLTEHNQDLGDAIEGLIRGALNQEYLLEKLTDAEWLQLRASMLYTVMAVLRAINEARREEQG